MNKRSTYFLIISWISILCVGTFIYFKKAYPNMNIKELFSLLLFEYSYLFFLLLSFLLLFILIQYKYYKNTLDKGKNCQVQFLRLEEIATTWLTQEDIQNNIKETVKNNLQDTETKMMQDLSDIVSIFLEKNIKNTQLVNEHITPNIHMFTEKEINIILTLLELLEKNSDVSSVASLNKEDSEYKSYKKIDITQTETKYQILKQYTLLEHTLNVVRYIVENLKNDHFDNFIFLLPKAIIVALSHDIGKIVNINVLKGVNNLDNSIYNKVPHEKISKMIMNTIFSDYENIDEICAAIEEHHIPNADTTFGMLLKKADHEARNYEVKNYLQKQRNISTEKIVDETTDNLKKQISTLVEEKNKKDLLSNENKDFSVNRLIEQKEPQKLANLFNEVNDINSNENELEKVTSNEEEYYFKYDQEMMAKLCERIINQVNTVHIQRTSKRKKILSISVGENIYIEDTKFKSILKSLKFNIKTEDDLKDLFKELKTQTLLKTKSVYLSFENLQNSSNMFKIEYHCFNGNALGLSARELDLKKRENPDLRNVKVIIRNNINEK